MIGYPSDPRAIARLFTLAACLWLGFMTLAPETGFCQQWDDFPRLPSGRWLGLAPSVEPHPFRTTESCLGSSSSRIGAVYAAAVVQISDSGGRASASHSNAVPYVDALYQDWQRTNRLNAGTHVLIVVSLKNRGIAVHPGTRWADLGFEGRTITKVIDRSGFGDLARSGEMGRAICALVADIEEWIGDRLGRQQRQAESMAGELGKLSTLRATLNTEILELQPELPELSEKLSIRLTSLEDDLSAGRRSLQRQRLSHAESAIREGRQGLENIRSDLVSARRAMRSLDQYRPKLASLEKKLASTPGSDTKTFERARRQLLECRKLLDTLEIELLSGELGASDGAERCVNDYQSALENAVALRYFKQVVVPALLLAGSVLLFLAALLFQLYRIRRARRQLRDLMDSWRRRLDHTADRLLELETRHPLYFQPDFQRWTGAGHELDRNCADAVNRVYMLYSEANLLFERASDALAELKFSRLRGLGAGARLLQDTIIHLGTDGTSIDPTKLRLAGTEPASVICPAAELLDEIDLTYDDLLSQLREVTQIAERFWELVGDTDVMAGQASEACARRLELESPIDALSRRLEPILDRRQEALALARDPVTANPKLEAVLEELTTARDQARSGNLTLEALRGPVVESARQLRARVKELREQGYTLEEPGFSPDLRLDRGVHQARQIETAVARGEEQEAADQLSALKRSLEELAQQLDTICNTRERLPEAVRAMESDAQALRARISKGQEILDLLRREHDPDAFVVESDNLEELEGILGSFELWGKQIREDYNAQRYLAAAEDLSAGEELVSQGNELLDSLNSIEEDLRQTRRRAEQQVSACNSSASHLESLRRRAGVGPELRHQGKGVVAETRSAVQAAAADRPHWPRVEQDLTRHLVLLETVTGQVEQELADYQESRRLLASIGDRLATLNAEVEREQRDRAFVAQATAKVVAAYSEWRTAVEQTGSPEPSQGGSALLAQGREVLGKLEWADGLWRSEMDLVRLAESKLAAAQDRFDREHGRNYGYGVVARCNTAKELLEDCRRLRRHREWDQILELSSRVTEEITTEAHRARQLASSREDEERRQREAQRRAEERERKRRQQEAAAAAAQVAASAVSSWSGSRTSSSSFGRRSGGFRSSSGGSSFKGGSRSGGSSW